MRHIQCCGAPPPLKPLDQSALALNGLVHDLVVVFRDHAVGHLEQAARTAEERHVGIARSRPLTFMPRPSRESSVLNCDLDWGSLREVQG